jgi:hypothetical protein
VSSRLTLPHYRLFLRHPRPIKGGMPGRDISSRTLLVIPCVEYLLIIFDGPVPFMSPLMDRKFNATSRSISAQTGVVNLGSCTESHGEAARISARSPLDASYACESRPGDRQKWGAFAKWVLRMGEDWGMCFAHRRIVISETARRWATSVRPSISTPSGTDARRSACANRRVAVQRTAGWSALRPRS